MGTELYKNVNEITILLPEEFIELRKKLLELAVKCGYSQDRIKDIDIESFRHAILYKSTYQTWFYRYAFSDVPPTLKKIKTEFQSCDGCFFDGKGICYSGEISLPSCAGEGEPIIFVLNNEVDTEKQS